MDPACGHVIVEGLIWAGTTSNVRERCEKGVKKCFPDSGAEKRNRHLILSWPSDFELGELKYDVLLRIRHADP